MIRDHVYSNDSTSNQQSVCKCGGSQSEHEATPIDSRELSKLTSEQLDAYEYGIREVRHGDVSTGDLDYCNTLLNAVAHERNSRRYAEIAKSQEPIRRYVTRETYLSGMLSGYIALDFGGGRRVNLTVEEALVLADEIKTQATRQRRRRSR